MADEKLHLFTELSECFPQCPPVPAPGLQVTGPCPPLRPLAGPGAPCPSAERAGVPSGSPSLCLGIPSPRARPPRHQRRAREKPEL